MIQLFTKFGLFDTRQYDEVSYLYHRFIGTITAAIRIIPSPYHFIKSDIDDERRSVMHITKQHLQSINKSNHLVLNSCDIQFNVLEDNDNGENDHSNTADIAKHLEHYLKDIISISKKTIFGSSDFNYSICTDSDGSNIGWIDIYSDEERGVDIRCLLKIPFMNNIGCEDNSERNNIAASSITATMKIICSINEKFDIRFICE